MLAIVTATRTTAASQIEPRPAALAAGTPAMQRPACPARLLTASWYGPRHHGRRTASGEIFDSTGLTAAHQTLPFGTKLAVVNPANGKSVMVRVNDRGPYAAGRSLDLSEGAARSIGIHAEGIATVQVIVPACLGK